MARGRYTADVEGSFVVFLIGMRVNALWRIDQWILVFLAMPWMLRELRGRDRSGLLDSRLSVTWRGVTMVQYWESFESLRDYAQDPDGHHHEAWVEYNRDRSESGAVGIWHETYLVDADDAEAVYNGVPEAGLAAIGDVVSATGRRESAAGRIGHTDGSDAPIDPGGVSD